MHVQLPNQHRTLLFTLPHTPARLNRPPLSMIVTSAHVRFVPFDIQVVLDRKRDSIKYAQRLTSLPSLCRGLSRPPYEVHVCLRKGCG